MTGDRGSAPIWFLGLAVAVLFFGAVGFELWRLLGERQQLVAAADAAAIAGASGLDVDLYRTAGEIRLDPGVAAAMAEAVIDAQPVANLLFDRRIEVAEDGSSLSVTLVREVEYGLIRVLALSDEAFIVSATATAYPASP
jgi:Flp pilus assembly protein TadG